MHVHQRRGAQMQALGVFRGKLPAQPLIEDEAGLEISTDELVLDGGHAPAQ